MSSRQGKGMYKDAMVPKAGLTQRGQHGKRSGESGER